MMALIPQTKENRAALRTALAALTAVLISFALHLERPYWSGMTVVILANIYTGSVMDKAIMRLAGTFIGAWAGYFLAGFAQSLLMYFLFNFLIVSLGVYYYNFSRYAYAWLMTSISAFIVIAELAIDPDDAFLVAIWRPVEIGLGVVISGLFAFSVFPNFIGNSLALETGAVFDELEHLFKSIGALLNDGKGSSDAILAANVRLKNKIRNAEDMIDFMRFERGSNRMQMDRYRFVLGSCFELTRTVSYFFSTEEMAGTWPVKEKMDIWLNELRRLKKVVAEGGSVSSNDSYRSRDEYSDINWLGLNYFFNNITRILQNLKNILLSGKGAESKAAFISHEQQLRHDPEVMIHSLKVGLAAVLALAFWLFCNWPGGLNGIVSSIVISIRRNLFDMKNISTFRLLGCFLGAFVFFFFTFFFPMNLYLFSMILFFTVWAFSWFSFKYSSYAYVGLQANIALIIVMAQEGGPPMVIAPALERLGGIGIGIVASFLVANLIWRTDVFTMLQTHLRRMYRFIKENTVELLQKDSENQLLYDLNTSFRTARGLFDSLDKSRLSESKQKLLEEEKAFWDSLILMQVMLNNLQNKSHEQQALETAKKLEIDIPVLKKNLADLMSRWRETRHTDSAAQKSLIADLKHHLAMVKKALNDGLISSIEAESLNAYLQSLLQLAEFMPLVPNRFRYYDNWHHDPKPGEEG